MGKECVTIVDKVHFAISARGNCLDQLTLAYQGEKKYRLQLEALKQAAEAYERSPAGFAGSVQRTRGEYNRLKVELEKSPDDRRP